MYDLHVTGISLADAYHGALVALHDFHEEMPCPDYNTRQKEASVTFVVENALAEPMISRCFIGGPKELEQYVQEMLDGILDFEIEKGLWDYTYHARMEEQLPWIIEELARNPDSRRAVINIRTEEDKNSTSPACLQNLQFFIRGGHLHLKILIRSNDAPKAAFMNAFALIMLQKRVAETLGVPVGSYVHRANSFHAYERDYGLLDGYVKRILGNDEITYNYVGDWDEEMAAERENIAKAVEELKGR
jgi:thymidylate synthase